MELKNFSLIAAVDIENGIGNGNTIPWRLPSDMKFFKEVTCCPKNVEVNCKYALGDVWGNIINPSPEPLSPQKFLEMYGIPNQSLTAPTNEFRNCVIMGRNTWESIPEKFRPLPDRLNLVLSRSTKIDNVLTYDSLDNALMYLNELSSIQEVFVIGGAQIYNMAITHPLCKKIYLTILEPKFECDTFFPKLPSTFKFVGSTPTLTEKDIKFKFTVYERT